MTVNESEGWLAMERAAPSGERALCLFNFAHSPRRVSFSPTAGEYELALASWDARYGGDVSSVQPRAELSASDGAPAAVQVAPLGAAIYLKTRP